MGVFSFIKKKFDEKKERDNLILEGKKAIEDKINGIILDPLSGNAAELTAIMNTHYLEKDLINKKIKDSVAKALKEYMQDDMLSEIEYNKFNEICKSLNVELPKKEQEFLKYKYTIWRVQETGFLPTVSPSEVDIPLKRSEIVHYSSNAILRKIKTKTTSVRYAGPAVSIKICKGVRYRVGSLGVNRTTSTYVDNIDSGKFYITNQRLVFIGSAKNFTYPINKIIKTEVSDIGLTIQKENTSNPQIVGLNEYELSMSIMSNVLNENI